MGESVKEYSEEEFKERVTESQDWTDKVVQDEFKEGEESVENFQLSEVHEALLEEFKKRKEK